MNSTESDPFSRHSSNEISSNFLAEPNCYEHNPNITFSFHRKFNPSDAFERASFLQASTNELSVKEEPEKQTVFKMNFKTEKTNAFVRTYMRIMDNYLNSGNYTHLETKILQNIPEEISESDLIIDFCDLDQEKLSAPLKSEEAPEKKNSRNPRHRKQKILSKSLLSVKEEKEGSFFSEKRSSESGFSLKKSSEKKFFANRLKTDFCIGKTEEDNENSSNKDSKSQTQNSKKEKARNSQFSNKSKKILKEKKKIQVSLKEKRLRTCKFSNEEASDREINDPLRKQSDRHFKRKYEFPPNEEPHCELQKPKKIQNHGKNFPKIFGPTVIRFILKDLFSDKAAMHDIYENFAIIDEFSMKNFKNWVNAINSHYTNINMYRKVWLLDFKEEKDRIFSNILTEFTKLFLYTESYYYFIVNSGSKFKNAEEYLKYLPIFTKGVNQPGNFRSIAGEKI